MQQEAQILSININNKKTLISIGTLKGFEIYSFFTFQKLRIKDFGGGIGPIDVLETSNIIAMTGGGLFPYIPPNKLVIWDDDQEKIKAEIVFKTQIKGIKFKYEFIFIITDYKIFIYNLFENLTYKMEIGTLFNPKGKLEINSVDNEVIFAYTTNKEYSDLSEEKGVLCVMNLTKGSSPTTVIAHNSKIKAYRLNYNGTLLATASMKGTLIRIFNTQTGKLLRECRRGYESTSIYSLDFDYFDQWLVCVCKTESVHLWKLNLGQSNQNQKSTFGWLTKFLPLMDDKTNTRVKLSNLLQPIIFFDHNSQLQVLSYNGN